MDAPDYGKQVNFTGGRECGKQVNLRAAGTVGNRSTADCPDCGKQVNYADGRDCGKHHMYRHTQIACSGQQM
jgi:hypothetical protein